MGSDGAVRKKTFLGEERGLATNLRFPANEGVVLFQTFLELKKTKIKTKTKQPQGIIESIKTCSCYIPDYKNELFHPLR